MKFKMFALVGAMLAAGLLFLGTPKADAQEIVWAWVNVTQVNMTPTALTIRATEEDGVFTNKQFRIDPANPSKNAYLAVILTAISLDSTMRVGFYEGTPATLHVIGMQTHHHP